MNARSIISKLSDLDELIKNRNPDLVLICETWLNENDENVSLNLDGYNLEPELRKDRTDTVNGIGGGLLVYSRSGIIIKPVLNEIDFNQYCQFEVISKEKRNSENLNFTLVYRPPKNNKLNLTKLCDAIKNVPDNSILIGDFNLPNIDWKNEECKDAFSEEFLETVVEANLEQMIDFKTHVKGNILDLLLTNKPENIISVECLGNLGNSDHSIIEAEIRFSTEIQENKVERLDWKNCDNEGLKDYFDNIDWSNILANKSCSEQWDTLKNVIETGTNRFVPKLKENKKRKTSWMTKKVKKLLNKKYRLFKLVKNNGSVENLKNLKDIEKKCRKAVRNAKMNYEKMLSEKNESKPFHAYVRNKTKNKTSVGPLKVDGKIISDNKQIAKVLNDYFLSVYTRENIDNVPNCPAYEGIKLENVKFTSTKIEKKIRKLKPVSAPGPDKISSKILKDHSYSFSIALATIFNSSLQSGEVPSDWRMANVTAIFKKGAKGMASNYRPVSLTSIPCKLMESLLKDEIVDHLLRNELLKSSQHGFMKNKSTVTNLLEFFDKITEMYDKGEAADVIYLDFSKAFDKVPAKRLLNKIEAYGVQGNILKWIENWLKNRYQRTVLNGQYSEWGQVLSGVPQGSVLGPLAFVIFIDDIDNNAKFIDILNKFADDTKGGKKIQSEDDARKLQDCLSQLVDWANKWGMAFNVDKCSVLHFGNKNQKFKYEMNGKTLNSIDTERDLGVLVSSNLRPSVQCLNAVRKARLALRSIEIGFVLRDQKVFVNIYKQFVRCHLEHASQVWNPWTVADIDKLEKVQKKAVNMVRGLDGLNYEEKLKKLNLEPLYIRRRKADLILVFKILNGFCNVDKESWFTTVGNETLRTTRLNSYHLNLKKQKFRTEIRKNFFTNRVVDEWNKLPTSVKDSKTVNEFKTKIYKHNFI